MYIVCLQPHGCRSKAGTAMPCPFKKMGLPPRRLFTCLPPSRTPISGRPRNESGKRAGQNWGGSSSRSRLYAVIKQSSAERADLRAQQADHQATTESTACGSRGRQIISSSTNCDPRKQLLAGEPHAGWNGKEGKE